MVQDTSLEPADKAVEPSMMYGTLILHGGDYMYGPYIDLESGDYQLILECEFDQRKGSLTAQMTAENGGWTLET